ncbi:hypothetical protein U3653_07145 [Nocardia sp. CDC186]|uniref:Uncharacterized protein n=1 Tax=Nocardia implantans TaxID=3108168 RepID=A0ABU6ARH8_9NOCA|nr:MULTISPECIES: hypothetical protein [unclassified Nocardia]MBF6190128.1 hypothetical protein [Nocardia beijingensis]MEA3526639.1 hypothetical protein [Nocardia sp. CDC192]MEB3509784.1 hypothetical protein [Nocardia sp. CDC186]
MSGVAQMCAYLPHREPGHDIDAFDRLHGSEDFPDPLLTAHRLGRFYLSGASNFVRSIGHLISLEAPPTIAPGVLARSAAEYAARANFVTNLDDNPETRVSKMERLFSDGLQNMGVNSSDATPDEAALARRINRWRSQTQLPRVKVPNFTDSVIQLSPDLGPREYPLLSRLVHANAVTVAAVTISEQTNHYTQVMDAWRHALFAAWCTLKATVNACIMRVGDKEPVNFAWGLYSEVETTYNRYLWDLTVAQGFTPDAPRP